MTDHRHIAELLHARATRGQETIGDLLGWLRGAIAEAATSDRTRRLESDADAVQIMTIHRAKGLQFPVVLLPDASSHRDADKDDGRRLVLPAPDGRDVDLGGRRSPGRPERWRQFQLDESDEELRALYVGLTRAQSHAIAWWAHHWEVAGSPLHRVLCADHHATAPARPQLAYGVVSPTQLAWPDAAGIAVVPVPDSPAPPPPPEPAAPPRSRPAPGTGSSTTRGVARPIPGSPPAPTTWHTNPGSSMTSRAPR